jgi:hypothetical protein
MISHLRALLIKNTFSLNFNILSLNCCGVLNRMQYPEFVDLIQQYDLICLTVMTYEYSHRRTMRFCIFT